MINNKDKKFLGCIFIFSIISFIYFFEGRMNVQNTTAYLFSYKHGFIPRGLLGTILNGCADIMGLELTYNGMLAISMIATIILYVCLFVLFAFAVKLTNNKKIMYYVLTFVGVICFPMFLTWNNFGRLDEYLVIITIVSVILLLVEKGEWLVIPLCLMACFTHVGFVFTNVGVILAILFYKALNNKEKRKKYLIILFVVFVECALVFLITEIFTTAVSKEAYDSIVFQALNVANQGGNIEHFKDANSLLNSELLKQSVYEAENIWREKNVVEAPIFVILFLPYIIIGLNVFIKTIKSHEIVTDKIKYLAILLGIATILPELILKVDYGRWMFDILLYYGLVTIYLLTHDEGAFVNTLKDKLDKVAGVVMFPAVFVIYPMFFVPFKDVYICDLTTKIMNVVAGWIGLW